MLTPQGVFARLNRPPWGAAHAVSDRPADHPAAINSTALMRLSGFFHLLGYYAWPILTRTIRAVPKRRLSGLAAEVAYNAMLALFPAILAVLTTISFSRSAQGMLERLASRLGQVAPVEVLFLIQRFAEEVMRTDGHRLFSISFIAAIWIASSAIGAVMNALDLIQQTPPVQRRPYWHRKLVSLGLTIGTLIMLVVASFLVFISDLLVRLLATRSCLLDLRHDCPASLWILTGWRLLSWPLALGIVALTVALIYRLGPSRRLVQTPIAPGAVLAALSWAGLSALFRLYVSQYGTYNKVYGAVGAVIVLLLWLYLSALVILIGHQLNVTIGAVIRERDQRDQTVPDHQRVAWLVRSPLSPGSAIAEADAATPLPRRTNREHP
ncbi:YihY/virulence factor BrkB family protein [Trichothermofontia sp.]